jgi:hypothetical protein
MARRKKANFGMLSVKAGIDNNPNPTAADRIAGATKGKNKKTMKKNNASKGKMKAKSGYLEGSKEVKFGKAYGGNMRKAQDGLIGRGVEQKRKKMEKKAGINTGRTSGTTGLVNKPKTAGGRPAQSGQSFSEAFAAARKRLGPGKTFTYKGKSYSTNRADDKKPSKPVASLSKKSAGPVKSGVKKPGLQTSKSPIAATASKSKKATREDNRMARKATRAGNASARAENKAGRKSNRTANRNARKLKRSERRGGNLAASTKMQGKELNLPRAGYGKMKKAQLGLLGAAAGAMQGAQNAEGGFGQKLLGAAKGAVGGSPLGRIAGAVQGAMGGGGLKGAMQGAKQGFQFGQGGQDQATPQGKKGKLRDRRKAKAKKGRARK